MVLHHRQGVRKSIEPRILQVRKTSPESPNPNGADKASRFGDNLLRKRPNEESLECESLSFRKRSTFWAHLSTVTCLPADYQVSAFAYLKSLFIGLFVTANRAFAQKRRDTHQSTRHALPLLKDSVECWERTRSAKNDKK